MPGAEDTESLAGNAKPIEFGRRTFLKNAGVTAVVAATERRIVSAAQPTAPVEPDGTALSEPMAGEVNITLDINGAKRAVTVEPRTTLLSACRDRLEPPLTGAKLVCNAGTCGACTMMVDGRSVYGCSMFAIDVVGKKVTTVEGLGTPEKLSPVQAAMMEKDAMMCGFCTAGFVTAITAFLKTNPNPTMDDVKKGLKGNFCRCGTYTHIFEATLAAAKVMRG